MSKVDDILKEAVCLPEDQRLSLAHRLLAVGEPAASADIDEAWDVAIRERIARYDRGEATARPAADVLADLDRRLHR